MQGGGNPRAPPLLYETLHVLASIDTLYIHVYPLLGPGLLVDLYTALQVPYTKIM